MEKRKLEQEPCEDAISRQAVEKITWQEPSYTDALNVLTEIREKVRALPPVTPQPKMGRWKIIEELHGEWEGTKKYACDKCGEKVGIFKSNYCPNCGQPKMVEPQEVDEPQESEGA